MPSGRLRTLNWAFAKIQPADERDLTMMKCHAVIYDEVTLTRRNAAPGWWRSTCCGSGCLEMDA
jgi:hypothetical protein